MTDPIPVTVIIPVLDEADSIGQLLTALLAGTRPPDEIVVADGGSTDATRAIVEGFGPPVRLIVGPGGISENRNAAIVAASNAVIACTDAGCLPDPDWLENLTAPFERGAQWVGGLSRPARRTRAQTLTGLAMMPVVEEIDLDHFVPGGASQAFTREAWLRAGRFPEGMRAGEDTLFGQRLNAIGIRPVVITDAQVVWQSPRSVSEMARKAYAWGHADGSAGTASRIYAKTTALWLGGTLEAVTLFVLGRRGLAAACAGAVLGASAWVTRNKHRALAHPASSVAIPPLHALRIGSQSLGWLDGYLNRPDRADLATIGRRFGARAAMAAKRTIRPFLPEPLMARLRTTRSRAGKGPGRSNVDVLVGEAAAIKSWLAATPDTYRVGVEPATRSTDEAQVVIRPETADEETVRRLQSAIVGDVEAAVLASTVPPRIDLGRYNEPTIDPIAVAVRSDALPTPIPADPSTLQHMVRQAGLHQAVIPVPGFAPKPSLRPISGAGAAVILGTVPMHDIGGGSRGAQMAHELIARGYHVTYLNLFESDEAVNLGLRYVHPNLDEIAADRFDFDRYLARLATEVRVGILELPHVRYSTTVAHLRTSGFRTVYDLMDDWSDDALGGWGYTRRFEDDIARACDALVASAPSLVERLEAMSGRPVSLAPNAVNIRIFDPTVAHPKPEDLPDGDGPVLEYHGSLYGDWFDWRALERTALTHPSARLVIIGDDRNHPPMPSNVHFLGLKPQHLLPAYLAHTDVAMIPFEVSETTHAVSPLKVFEYLAMGVPVASVPLAPVVDLDGVFTDLDLSLAVDIALQAPKPDSAAVASAHGWGDRMATIFEALGFSLATDRSAVPIHIMQHGVTHWADHERRL